MVNIMVKMMVKMMVNFDCGNGDDDDDDDDDDLLLSYFRNIPMAIPLNAFKYVPFLSA